MCFAQQRRALFRHLNFQEWSEHGVFFILTSKCASRHNGVHFLDISTSKSSPSVRCFLLFHLQMCLAPQRRALFRHRIFQKWSEPGALCTFWLRNVLRATTACNCSSLIWPDGSTPAALASLLFDPPQPQIIGKHKCFATFLPFRAPASSFFWLFLFSDLLSSALLSSTLLFSLTLPISALYLSIFVGSLTSKLSSTILDILRLHHLMLSTAETNDTRVFGIACHSIASHSIALRCIALTFTLQILQHIKLRFDTKQPITFVSCPTLLQYIWMHTCLFRMHTCAELHTHVI